MTWKSVAKGFGYAAFFFVSLLFFLYVTFPMDQVRGFVEYQAKKKLKMDVRIGDLDLKGLSGIELWDVVLIFPEKEPEEEAAAELEETGPGMIPGRPGAPGGVALPRGEAAPKGEGAAKDDGAKAAKGRAPRAKGAAATAKAADPPAEEAEDGEGADEKDGKGKKDKALSLKIDHMDIGVRLLDVAFGKNPDIRVDAELLGGSVKDMTISRDGKAVHVEAREISGLNLTDSRLVSYFIPFDIRGKLSGNVDFTWGGTLYGSHGTVEMQVAATKVVKPVLKSKQYGEFVLTDVKAGSLAAKVVVGKKKAFPMLRTVPGSKDATVVYFEKLEANGDDAELLLDERSAFLLKKGRPFKDASMNMELVFFLADGFFNREVTREGEKEKPNKFLKTLLEHEPKWKKAEKNGYYGLRCTGTVKKPDCNPTKPTMRVGFARPKAADEPEEKKDTEDKRKEPSASVRPGKAVQPAVAVDRGHRVGTAKDLPSRPQPKIEEPPVANAAANMTPKERIDQLKRERAERMRKMREARGLPPEEEPVVDEVPLDDEDLVEPELGDELLPEDELEPIEEGALDEPLPEGEGPAPEDEDYHY